MSSGSETSLQWQLQGNARPASSIARRVERKKMEEEAITEAIAMQVEKWKAKGDWDKLKCVELLVVRGLPNKDAADMLELTEQQVANFKFDFLSRLRTLIKRQGLSQEVFPELYDE